MTNTDLATTDGALAIRADQDRFDQYQLAALNQLGIRGATNADLAVFMHYCQRTQLDPFTRQIYMIKRGENIGGQWIEKQVIQVGIDGFRVVARRAAKREHETLEYEDSAWCGPDGQWTDVWLGDGPPFAARVRVLRNGKPFPGVVRYSAFAPMKNGKPVSIWARMDAEQLEKCAEAKALRRAYPHDLGNIYLPEEMPAPRHANGMIDSSQMNEAEQNALGVMTRHQKVEHDELRRAAEHAAGTVEVVTEGPEPDDAWTGPAPEKAPPQPASKAALERLDKLVGQLGLGPDDDVRALFEWLTGEPWTATRSQVHQAHKWLDDILQAAQGDTAEATNQAWHLYNEANPQAGDDGA